MSPDVPSRDELPEIVLISVGEIGSGALEAHLGELARRLSPHALVHWVALASPRRYLPGPGRRVRLRFARSARRGLSGSLLVLPHPPGLRAIGATGLVVGAALRAILRTRAPVLHARGYLATLVALSARRLVPEALVLHDVRGDRPAEVRIHGGELPAERVAELEGVAARGADAHLAVSGPLRALLRERHGVESEILACAADTETFRFDAEGRRRVRSELGLDGELVLGFAGSCAPWQGPDALALLFAKLRALRPSARLLVLSPDHAEWTRELARHGLAADHPSRPAPGAPAFVRSVPHADVPAWLSACDVTALLRADDDVNRVASPIKFGESLACGVPVIVTARLGDASALVEARGLGAVVSGPRLDDAADDRRLREIVAGIETRADALRHACREAAESTWSWKQQLPARLAGYARLARERSRGGVSAAAAVAKESVR